MQLIDLPAGTFTTQECARLAVYRAAVAAGFYSDWDGSADQLDTEALDWLAHGDATEEGEAYPFSAAEREHLERCRQAFNAGDYADDLPPTTAAAAGSEEG